MKKNVKKGLGMIAMYGMVVVLTLLLANRIERLESREDIQNQNTNIAFNLK